MVSATPVGSSSKSHTHRRRKCASDTRYRRPDIGSAARIRGRHLRRLADRRRRLRLGLRRLRIARLRRCRRLCHPWPPSSIWFGSRPTIRKQPGNATASTKRARKKGKREKTRAASDEVSRTSHDADIAQAAEANNAAAEAPTPAGHRQVDQEAQRKRIRDDARRVLQTEHGQSPMHCVCLRRAQRPKRWGR